MKSYTEDGILVLADISGFTAFVTATELEHGPDRAGLTAHSERYEHLGDVQCFVRDLERTGRDPVTAAGAAAAGHR